LEYEIHRRRVENNEPVGDIAVRGGKLKATKISSSEIGSVAPELPILAVIAGAADGVTVIRGVTELQDAGLLSLGKTTENLRRMGVKIAELEDGWAIEGPTEWHAIEFDCADDPAMGIAVAVAGLHAEKESEILNAELLRNRFPDLQQKLIQLSSK
jgi:3-phosphoshikimate 1-carboxyvinyltransferase